MTYSSRKPMLTKNQMIEELRLAALSFTTDQELALPESSSIKQLINSVVARLDATEGPGAKSPIRPVDARTADQTFSQLATTLLRALSEHNHEHAAEVCAEIAAWAENRHTLPTAAWFIEAAVVLNPHDAAKASKAGHFARKRAEYEVARGWFERAIEIASQQGEWNVVAGSWMGIGTIERRTGDPEDAAAAFMKGLAVARRHGVAAREGEGFHNLAVISFEQNKLHDGISYARQALDAYGYDRKRIAYLANDLAWQWMDAEGAYERALTIFERVYKIIQNPAHRIILRGNMARAAAGTGNENGFASARASLQRQLESVKDGDGEGHPQSLLEVAKGAALLGNFRLAAQEAEAALMIATKRGEVPIIEEIHQFQQSCVSTTPQERRSTSPNSDAVEQRMDDLIMELLLALR